jgi:hypothetical protein
MIQPDVAATVSVGPPPVIADVHFDPNGVQTVTVNLPGVRAGGRTITINSMAPTTIGGDDQMSDNDLLARVGRLESSVTTIAVDLSAVKTDMKHVATKSWIAGWGLACLAATVLILWRIIAVLLDSQGAHIAAEIMKASAK